MLFRGQKEDHPLLPKICRLQVKDDLLNVESAIFQEFKRTNLLLIEYQRVMDDWDYLTLGQHYGLPTRLLDWSENSLTALWFATEPSILRKKDDAVVWILSASMQDFIQEPDKLQPFKITKMTLFRPRIIKQRINNQSGVFSLFSSQELLKRTPLNRNLSFANQLLKVNIPDSALQAIRNDLDTFGVNAFTIFPELDGLCTYLQWKYFDDQRQVVRQDK